MSEERAAGRGGLGAVMGSKNLKAIVAQGNFVSQAKDKEKLKSSAKMGKKAERASVDGEQLPNLERLG